MQRALNQRPSLRKKQGLKIWMGELSSQVDSILSIPGYAAAAPGATPLALPDLIFLQILYIFSCLGDEFCETEMPFCSKGPATMPTSKPNEEVVAKLKACFWLLIELCF